METKRGMTRLFLALAHWRNRGLREKGQSHFKTCPVSSVRIFWCVLTTLLLLVTAGGVAHAQQFIARGDTWRFFKGTVEPPADWRALGFDDSAWPEGPTGIGYGDADDATVLSDMRNGYISVFARRRFFVADPSQLLRLILWMDYDDGFVASINGEEVARRGVSGSPPPHTAAAVSHEARKVEPFDISSKIGLPVAGENVLAVQGHNDSPGSVGSPGSATITIIDEPVVTIKATDATATEAGPTTGTFTVKRTGSTADPLTVFYTVSGTATPGVDYTALPGSVTIPAGSSTATILVNPINDALMEGKETVIVKLLANAAYTVGRPSSATVTISSDEKVTIVATDATATEAGPTTGTFTVKRTGSTADPLTVFYTVSGTATPGVDYTALPGSVTIPAGSSTATILVTPIDDPLVEGNQTVIVKLSSKPTYTVGTPSSATVTIASDPGDWRGPYLQLGTSSSILVVFDTDVACTGYVDYGPTEALGSRVTEASAGTKHAVPLSGLIPATEYSYQVGCDEVRLRDGTWKFRMYPEDAAAFTFAVLGDSGSGDEDPDFSNQLNVARLIESWDPLLILHTGDIVYGAVNDLQYDLQYFDVYRSLLRSRVMYMTQGNHDKTRYRDVFHLPSNNPAGTELYYSFDAGNVHFISLGGTKLCTLQGCDAAMVSWLDNDLKATSKPWKIVFMHFPPYASGPHPVVLGVRNDLVPLFDAHGVDLVFTGHNHNYERTFPIQDGFDVNKSDDPHYRDPAGPIYVVTGGGGNPRLAEAGTSNCTAFSKGVTTADPITYHAVRVEVNGTLLALRAFEPGGTTPFDEVSIDKALPAPLPVPGAKCQMLGD